MSDETDGGEKEHSASQKKLDDARKRGDVAKSVDLIAAAVTAGLFLTLTYSTSVLSSALLKFQAMFGQLGRLANDVPSSFQPLVLSIVWPSAAFTFMVILVPGVFGLLAMIAQRSLTFAPEKLAPKLSRISPLATAKHKFGPEGLFDFTKNLLKLFFFGGALWWFLSIYKNELLATSGIDLRKSILLLLDLLGRYLLLVAGLLGCVGIVDLLWQHHARRKRNMMSRKEVQDEHKESDGDPHAKAERKHRAQDIAMHQLSAEVAKSSVIIVNPTHYAVALEWHRGSALPPIVLAKGVDAVALRIREIAVSQGIPIHSDPPTARAVYASIPIGSPIQKEHFKAVAAAMRFAELMRHQARKRPT